MPSPSPDRSPTSNPSDNAALESFLYLPSPRKPEEEFYFGSSHDNEQSRILHTRNNIKTMNGAEPIDNDKHH